MNRSTSLPTTGSISCSPEPAANRCAECGACCARFRVSFPWHEANDAIGGWVPVALTRRIDARRRAMAGTERSPVRCVALAGEVGLAVSCSIYAQRPTPCREFLRHGENGLPSPRCNQTRLAAGLVPLPDPA